MRVAIFWPGNPGDEGESHHGGLYEPAAVMHIAAAVAREVPEADVRIFAMERFGFQLGSLKQAIGEFAPDCLLASVSVSGYYPQVLQILEWAKANNIPFAMGGYHFCIPGTKIPEIAVELRSVPVAVGTTTGVVTAPKLVKALVGEIPMTAVPGICFWGNGQTVRTPAQVLTVNEIPHPVLNNWDYHPSSVRMRSAYPGIVGKFGPTMTQILWEASGCVYRDNRLGKGEIACAYCTLTEGLDVLSAQALGGKLSTVAQLARENGFSNVFIKGVGDDTANRVKAVESWIPIIQKAQDQTGVCFLFNLFAWLVPTLRHAQLLRELGVVYLYIGAEGKTFSSFDPSSKNPLVVTLENLERVGIKVDLGFVLGGEKGQTWDNVEERLRFARFLGERFGWDDGNGTLRLIGAWPYIASPGDPNWELILTKKFPHYKETDNPNLGQAQLDWLSNFTQLGDGQDVLKKFYDEIMPGFSEFSFVKRTYFVEPLSTSTD